MTSCERGPLLLGGHGLFDPVVMATVSAVSVNVTVVEALGERELAVAFPSSLLPQFVPVVLDV